METLFSDFKFTGLLLFGLLAAGANVIGGLLLVKSGAHRLGERFLKYAHQPGGGDETESLIRRVDGYVAEVRTLASSRAGGSRIDVRLAEAVATACKRLLARIERSPPDGQAAIVGAVRYFLDTNDVDRDDGGRGFADDAEVVNHVQSFVAPDLPRIPV